MSWLRVWVREGPRGPWKEIPNGPFPITRAQLEAARTRFAAEYEKCSPLEGARVAPQTTARAILRDVVPTLKDFDALMLGFAVTNPKMKTEEQV